MTERESDPPAADPPPTDPPPGDHPERPAAEEAGMGGEAPCQLHRWWDEDEE